MHATVTQLSTALRLTQPGTVAHAAAKAALAAEVQRLTRATRVRLVCQECGKRWSVRPDHPGPACPKCGGVDWDVA